MSERKNDRPNIIYFFCDELRCDGLGCYQEIEGISTPNIDKLADNGILFERCYCNSPVCVPSRYSVLTGCYPETTGVYHNEAARKEYSKRDRFVTIPEILKTCGYGTANFGKLHLPGEVFPFEYHNAQGSTIEDWDKSSDILVTRGIGSAIAGVYPCDREYTPEKVTRNALEWMEKQKQPYMVRISYLQPHTPVIIPSEYKELYRDIIFPVKEAGDASLSCFEQRFAENVDSKNLSEEQKNAARICYYSLVRWVDDQVGMVLNYLEEKGKTENTIIIFGADHGAMLGENGRFAKQTFSCWSHRVPLILYVPNNPERGTRRSDICENLDLGPTLFGLLGIKTPSQFQGRDLFSEKEPEFVYGSIGYGEKDSVTFPNKGFGSYINNRGWPRRACIRSRRYRLDMNIRMDGQKVSKEEEDVFLADLNKDPWEQYNMANKAEYYHIVLELKEKLLFHIAKNQEMGDR